VPVSCFISLDLDQVASRSPNDDVTMLVQDTIQDVETADRGIRSIGGAVLIAASLARYIGAWGRIVILPLATGL